MKLIAFYLPQYHQIKENDEWWEEGFTEWKNVKRAKKIFKGQTQPKIPLNNNYYNLLDKETVEWQTKLMKQYGVYGFCYFHYWFTGRKLLEKPAENLLRWKDIDQPFCFSWANVTWARTWTGFSGFSTNWVSTDKKQNGNGVLIEQKYGEKKEWIEHYSYLRPFFMDDRYIKVDNMPMFLIYHMEYIPHAEEFFETWNELARRDGFNGIHFVSMNSRIDSPLVKAVARYGQYERYDRKIFLQIRNLIIRRMKLPYSRGMILDYSRVWENMLKEKPLEGIQTYPGAVVTYDETPRKGKNAVFLKGASPELFERYLKMQIERAKSLYKSEYIFVDAWNEWGEGNYLEPDIEHGYKYLEAVKRALEEGRLDV